MAMFPYRWTVRPSGASPKISIRTCGEILLLMRCITIKRAPTWHYSKMRRCIDQSSDLAPLSPFRSWLDCIINMSGYDFRKGQPGRSSPDWRSRPMKSRRSEELQSNIPLQAAKKLGEPSGTPS
jgi:hypothetical protein